MPSKSDKKDGTAGSSKKGGENDEGVKQEDMKVQMTKTANDVLLDSRIQKRLQECFAKGLDKSVVDKRAEEFMSQLPIESVLNALNEFDRCLESQSERIRNKAAYLMGVLKKFQQGDGPSHGSSTGFRSSGRDFGFNNSRRGPDEMMEMFRRGPPRNMSNGDMDRFMDMMSHMAHEMGIPLPQSGPGWRGGPGRDAPRPSKRAPGVITPLVQGRLDKIFKAEFCKPADLDERVMKFLMEVPEEDALRALDEFSTSDKKLIKNFSAYLMGVLRKYGQASAAAAAGFWGGPAAEAPALGPGHITPKVQRVLDDIYKSGFCSQI